MPLSPGTHLGPYEITGAIGAGGMGEVYRAHDPKLNRDVAIKVLPERVAGDDDALARFEREAKTIAALSHPNLVAIFDFGKEGSIAYAVMELLEGETLRQALTAGALPVRKAVECGVQIAQGLASAHEKGIVHRDLKPDNIFVTADGRVKILDFGLAAHRPVGTEETDTKSPTKTSHTDPGTVLGTAGYMSPEQVKGLRVDHRADIFALGVVLHEMLTGRRAFHGDTAAETMAAILKEDVAELSGSGRAVPLSLDRLVRRCLEKRAEERFQSARDLAMSLEAYSGSETATAAPVGPATSTTMTGKPSHVHVAIGLVALGSLAGWFARRGTEAPTPPPSRVQFVLSLPSDVKSVFQPAVSPNGRFIAFSAVLERDAQIWIYDITTGQSRALPGTEAGYLPAWSTDGRSVAFASQGLLRRTSAAGGPVSTICPMGEFTSEGGSIAWGPDDTIIYSTSTSGPLWRVSAGGGTPERFVKPDAGKGETGLSYPRFTDQGGSILYSAHRGSSRKPMLVNRGLPDGLPVELGEVDQNAMPAGNDWLLSTQGRALVAHRLLNGVRTAGETVLADGLSAYHMPAAFDIAGTTLVYITPDRRTSLAWFSREGRRLSEVALAGSANWPQVARDGRRVVVDALNEATGLSEIWLIDGERRNRLPLGPSPSSDPVWSPDGQSIMYANRVGRELLEVPVGGGSIKAHLNFGGISDSVFPGDWSNDGRYIVYMSWSSGSEDIWLYPIGQKGGLVKVAGSPSNEGSARFSPDGRFVAYRSNESGLPEVYLQALPPATDKWLVSEGGGAEPMWRGDGRELFYLSPDNFLMAAPITLAPRVAIGKPSRLFKVEIGESTSLAVRNHYAVTPDGRRFIVNSVTGGAKLNVVLNWQTGIAPPADR